MYEYSILFAFTAGLISFLSPSILILSTIFFAYLAHASQDDANEKRGNIFLNSIFFVLGFSIILSVLGFILATVIEEIMYSTKIWISRLGGSLIIFFGLYLLELVHYRFFEKDIIILSKKKFNLKYLISFIFGAAFALGWMTSLEVIYGSILSLTISKPLMVLILLFMFAIGIGTPFLFVGLIVERLTRFISRYVHLMHYFTTFFGLLLILLGIIVFTENLMQINNFEFVRQILIK